MLRILKNILLYLFISLIIMIICTILKSDFLYRFLQKDLLTILIALFGLNVTILSILVSKLSDSKKERSQLDIKLITHEMRFSMREFFVLIVMAILSAIALNSEQIAFDYKELILSSILLSTLLYALVILWDTGNSIFILIQEEEDQNNLE